jgi:hypothetical protein
MNKLLSSFVLISTLLIMGCAPSNLVSDNTKWKPIYSFQVGIAHGGIIENTDLKQIPNTEIDAFTGATSVSPIVGANIKLPILWNEFEAGIDYMYVNQIFTYKDAFNGYNGKRELSTSQFIFPLTYNFKILRKLSPNNIWSFKIGLVGEYNLVKVNDNINSLPNYSINKFSGGFVFGAATMPFHFENNSKLGFFLDMYRGSRIYTDFYNLKSFKMPGSSFARFGIIYQFK